MTPLRSDRARSTHDCEGAALDLANGRWRCFSQRVRIGAIAHRPRADRRGSGGARGGAHAGPGAVRGGAMARRRIASSRVLLSVPSLIHPLCSGTAYRRLRRHGGVERAVSGRRLLPAADVQHRPQVAREFADGGGVRHGCRFAVTHQTSRVRRRSGAPPAGRHPMSVTRKGRPPVPVSRGVESAR